VATSFASLSTSALKPERDAARQALDKLGVEWEPTEFQRAYNEGRSTQVPVSPAVRVKGCFSRQLRYQDTELRVER
jgi:hypothetical protein